MFIQKSQREHELNACTTHCLVQCLFIDFFIRPINYFVNFITLVYPVLKVESMTKGSRPRAQKNPKPRPRTDFPRIDPLEAKDQGRNAQVFFKKKKKKERSSRKKKHKFFPKFWTLFEKKGLRAKNSIVSVNF